MQRRAIWGVFPADETDECCGLPDFVPRVYSPLSYYLDDPLVVKQR